ncbi:exported hypothetical protein [Verrucomicrobia bacterium]|nr:exported hypothetical protein [Verrucomicrobiota bacterium]
MKRQTKSATTLAYVKFLSLVVCLSAALSTENLKIWNKPATTNDDGSQRFAPEHTPDGLRVHVPAGRDLIGLVKCPWALGLCLALGAGCLGCHSVRG